MWSLAQTALATYKDALHKDGFEVPAIRSGKQRLAAVALNLRCKGDAPRKVEYESVERFPSQLQCGEEKVKHGWADMVQVLQSVRESRRSVILSAEDLDLPETNIEVP